MMMDAILEDVGCFRSGGVGAFAGDKMIHMSPPADLVPQHMADLLEWLDRSDDHPLIKSCVFHYAFEFIHPFSDGNGRIGRLWQTVILSRWKSVFQWVPVESLVYENRDRYYQAIGESTDRSDSSLFIDLMLSMIRDALLSVVDASSTYGVTEDGLSQDQRLILEFIGNGRFSSIRDACARLEMSESAMRRGLDSLREMGMIRRVGSRKSGHWEIVRTDG